MRGSALRISITRRSIDMYLPRVTHSSSHLLLLLLAVSSWWPPRAAAFVQQAGASTRQLSQWGNNVRAVGSSRVAATAGAQVSARWLEGNSWMFNIGGVNVLLDPLFSTLDFGMPALYTGDKVVLKDYDGLAKEMAAQADFVLITQGLADHCCPKTLSMLSKLLPSRVGIIGPPSASPVLSKYFSRERLTYLSPGDTYVLRTPSASVTLRATKGSLVGPPTQAPENGYLLVTDKGRSLFYEPHCMFDPEEVSQLRADVVFSPAEAVKVAGIYRLLNSGQKAVELARLLGATKIVSFANGALDSTGVLNYIAKPDSTVEDLDSAASAAGIQHTPAEPGKVHTII